MTSPSILDVLALEEIDRDIYRANFVQQEPYALYGGQVAAQALLAAGRTVPEGWLPHSMHGYFLRQGDSHRPTIFLVQRDRDGRSFAARRVIAVQDGEVIFNLSTSLTAAGDGPDLQDADMPVIAPADELLPMDLPRLASIQGRVAVVTDALDASSWPTHFWTRSELALPDDQLLHQAVLTYVSDSWSGVSALADERQTPGPTLDHALWFHRRVLMDAWVMTQLVPHSTDAGRGFYSGSFWQDGRLVASLTQECLFRYVRD